MPVDRDRSRLLLRRLDRLVSLVAEKPLPENIHRFRTCTRRVETLLETLVPIADRKQRKLLKLLGRLRRTAGRVRDVDVQSAALRGLKIPQEAERKAQLLRTLAELRCKREKKLLRTLEEEKVREVQKRLKKVAGTLPFSANTLDPLAEARRRFVEMARHHGVLTEELLHRYRIEGKRVRYVAELAEASPEAGQMVAELVRLQDRLGDWHDWLLLSGTAQELFHDGANSALAAALRNLTRAKFREAAHVVQEVREALLKPPGAGMPGARRKAAGNVPGPAAAVA